MTNSHYTYSWLPGGPLFTQNGTLIDEMVALYAGHYGRWSAASPVNPGQRIRVSATKIKAWTSSDDSIVAAAYHNGALVGYAIAVRTRMRYGTISWVTQFVIHADHRNRGVGRNLLFAIWGLSDHFAWGLVTASPYAVRALEKATRRRCIAQRIAKNHRKLLEVGAAHVPYITRETAAAINRNESRVDTHFYVDHSDVGQMLRNVTTDEKPWLLGGLQEGWEWFAFTFRDQEPIGLTSAEVTAMLEASDDVVKQAYSCMPVSSPTHRWSQHSVGEARLVADLCGVGPGSRILDLGCGPGRHSVELARMGCEVTGVDYIPRFIDEAKAAAALRQVHATWVVGDCRYIDVGTTFDVVICLYDVIGSYADEAQNMRIMRNIARHLKNGGKAIISVMNYEATVRRETATFNIATEADKLLGLPASQTMERTGDVFNPQYLLVDTATKVVYRREQFSPQKGALPCELIVRDRRYSRAEIQRGCEECGLRVIWGKCVRAGDWSTALAEDDPRAKEILVLCEKKKSETA